MSVDSTTLWPRCHVGLHKDPEETARINDLVRGRLGDMSIEQKASQLIQAELASITPEQAGEMCIGSILNGGGVYPAGRKDSTIQDWHRLAHDFHEASSNSATRIPILWGTDAVHGHNNVQGATLFPHHIGLGATNDPELVRRIGQETARDVSATGIQWTFAPTLAVPRDYRWGRTYEGFSQDPNIVAALGSSMLNGLQGAFTGDNYLGDTHILATAKHFIGEGATDQGMDQGHVYCSESILREIHAIGHLALLRSGAQVVMAAFNSWNGQKVHGSSYLLTDVLKNQMGFEGFVVSDWDGFRQLTPDLQESCAMSVNAGVDMLMVSDDWQGVRLALIEAVCSGEITQLRLDDAVSRVLRVKALCGLIRENTADQKFVVVPSESQLARPSAKNTAREAVRKSLVLLKNEDHLLPLRRDAKVLIVGEHATEIANQCGGWSLTWQGTGNENHEFPYATSIAAAVEETVHESHGSVEYVRSLESETQADVAIVIFGEAPYAEGEGDRNHLSYSSDQSQPLEEIKRLREQNIPVVSLFLSGRPLWVNPELNHSNAFVACWLPGTEGTGVTDVIFRDEQGAIAFDFHGRLPFSWPLRSSLTQVDEDSDEPDAYLKVGFGLTYSDDSEPLELDETDATEQPSRREWFNQGSYNYPR